MIDKLLPPPVLFQSTLPARGATRFIRARIDCTEISIHAPRTGSDIVVTDVDMQIIIISIHAPRTGSDQFVL